GIDRQDRIPVLDQVAKTSILLVADRRLHGERLPGKLESFPHFLERHAELLGQLLGGGLAADLVEHLSRCADDLVEDLRPMHGYANGPRLVGDRARDRLPTPPGGLGRELVATPVIALIA